MTHNLWLWPKHPPLAFSVAETSVAEMSGPKRPRPKCPWPKCPTFVAIGISTQLQSSGLVAHENSTFRNLALAVSGPFMA